MPLYRPAQWCRSAVYDADIRKSRESAGEPDTKMGTREPNMSFLYTTYIYTSNHVQRYGIGQKRASRSIVGLASKDG